MKLLLPLGYLWALPNTLLGLALAAVYASGLRWVGGCIEASCAEVPGGQWVGAQTHGWLILMRRDMMLDHLKRLRVHEHVHVTHQMILGILFYPAYGAHYAWNRIVLKMDHMTAYRNVWSERLAYKAEAKA